MVVVDYAGRLQGYCLACYSGGGGIPPKLNFHYRKLFEKARTIITEINTLEALAEQLRELSSSFQGEIVKAGEEQAEASEPVETEEAEIVAASEEADNEAAGVFATEEVEELEEEEERE